MGKKSPVRIQGGCRNQQENSVERSGLLPFAPVEQAMPEDQPFRHRLSTTEQKLQNDDKLEGVPHDNLPG